MESPNDKNSIDDGNKDNHVKDIHQEPPRWDWYHLKIEVNGNWSQEGLQPTNMASAFDLF